MPNATVRANARTTPNAPPKPGAAPSALTKATVNLENSVEMLKELRGVADKERVPFAVESAVLDVKIWASTACLLWQETRWSNQLTKEDGLAISRIDRLIERVNGAAEDLCTKYHSGAER
jgi:hypothetical protein